MPSTTGETVNLVILSGTETLYLDQVEGPSALQIHHWVGRRNPLHATANGRVLLAHASPPEQDAIIAAISDRQHRLPALTARTLTSSDDLRAALAEVRRRGYDLAVDELEIGLTAVAAPVRGADGTVIGSLSVSGPGFRLTADRIEDTVRSVLTAADEVSRRMGFSPTAVAAR